MTDYRLYGEKHWRAHDLFMENHQTKKNTRLTWSGFDFKTGLDENEFNKASLSRAR
ncbi:MAG: outer membrane lipoprotein-sorting protein [Pseudomonadota bacterium]